MRFLTLRMDRRKTNYFYFMYQCNNNNFFELHFSKHAKSSSVHALFNFRTEQPYFSNSYSSFGY